MVFDEKAVNKLVAMPVFSRLISYSGYKSVGIKISDRGKVISELTCSYKDKRARFSDGINSPDFVVGVEKKCLKSLDKKKLAWIRENPLQACFKYGSMIDIPFSVRLKMLSLLGLKKD